MLEIRLAQTLLVEAQEDYLRRGTMRGAGLALTVSTMRAMLRSQAESFNRRQRRAKGPLLVDGRMASIDAGVLDPYASAAWPARPAAILHGIMFPPTLRLPDQPCMNGGPSYLELDPEAYLTRMYVGPPEARSFGDMTTWTAYLHAVNRMYILWLGAEEDAEEALVRLMRITRGLVDWRSVDPEYDAVLASRCR